jgi:hypothetical protein
MAGDRPLLPSPMLHPDDAVPASASPRLMRAEFDALVTELHELRSRYQHELADRLRDTRASGSPGDNEDVLAVHEEVSVAAARIARLEELLRAVRVELPGGRERALRVLDVRPSSLGARMAALEGDAEAA